MEFFRLLSEKVNINLNEQQKNAVQHVDGPALVLAGPGSGKTTVIISRLAFLITEAGINPSNILSMTFNKMAALEMEERFNKNFSSYINQKIRFSTLHAFSYSILRDYQRKRNIQFNLIEGTDSRSNKRNLLKEIYTKANRVLINDDEMEELINQIGFVKNKLIKDIGGYKSTIRNFAEIFSMYEDFKQKNKLIDFDDMLSYSFSILRKEPELLDFYKNRYRYIQIDEGQDLSKIQLEIVRILAAPSSNLFVVADDDQSIYGFRGAEPQYLIDFDKYFPSSNIYLLETNYRSSKNIVESSSYLIKRNMNRYDKNHNTGNDYFMNPEIVNVKDENEQLDFIVRRINEISKSDKGSMSTAILYRNNLSSIVLIDRLDRDNIEFRIKDSKLFFFTHWFVQDIIAFIRFTLNQNDEESFQRIYYKMNRYISKSMMEFAINASGGKTLLDRMLKYENLKPYQRQKFIGLKAEFNSLSRMSPFQVLKYIELDFNYLENAQDYCEKCGYSYEYILDLFTIIRIVAERCQTLSGFLQRIEELENMVLRPENNKSKCRVTLSTIHSSKGLEYDNVFIVDLWDGEFPGKQSIDSAAKNSRMEQLEEERRLFYVGITRARKLLFLLCPQRKNDLPVVKSLFVRELEGFYEEKIMDNIDEGLIIQHKTYGEGIITGIFNNSSDGKKTIKVNFTGTSRLLDLQMCIDKGIINL